MELIFNGQPARDLYVTTRIHAHCTKPRIEQYSHTSVQQRHQLATVTFYQSPPPCAQAQAMPSSTHICTCTLYIFSIYTMTVCSATPQPRTLVIDQMFIMQFGKMSVKPFLYQTVFITKLYNPYLLVFPSSILCSITPTQLRQPNMQVSIGN